MNRATIEQLIDEATEEIRVAAHELIESIQQAELAALESSQESETARAKISIGAKIAIDLSANTFKVTVSVPVTHKVEGDQIPIGGPKQQTLPFDDLRKAVMKAGGTVEVKISPGTEDDA